MVIAFWRIRSPRSPRPLAVLANRAGVISFPSPDWLHGPSLADRRATSNGRDGRSRRGGRQGEGRPLTGWSPRASPEARRGALAMPDAVETEKANFAKWRGQVLTIHFLL